MPNSEKPLNQIKIPDGYTPSDKEEFMSPLQLAYFRKKLLDWKNELISGASDTILGLSEETLQKPDAADRAQLEADASILLRARDRERKLISKIDAALRRIADGSYGYCQETDEPINLKRLEARPIASLSLDAQEKHERMEKIHKRQIMSLFSVCWIVVATALLFLPKLDFSWWQIVALILFIVAFLFQILLMTRGFKK